MCAHGCADVALWHGLPFCNCMLCGMSTKYGHGLMVGLQRSTLSLTTQHAHALTVAKPTVEGAPRECERAGDTARVYRADSEAFAAKVLCVHRTYGKWDFPLVTHFRFSGWLLGSFPEIVYPVNLKHCFIPRYL